MLVRVVRANSLQSPSVGSELAECTCRYGALTLVATPRLLKNSRKYATDVGSI